MAVKDSDLPTAAALTGAEIIALSQLVSGILTSVRTTLTAVTTFVSAAMRAATGTWTAKQTFTGGASVPILDFATAASLTIAADTITVTGSYHTLRSEAAAATDNLTTISGGAIGQLLILRAGASAEDITVVSGATLSLAGGVSCVLDGTLDTLTLLKATSTIWVELSRSNNS